MQETPATQYIFAPGEIAYHLVKSECFTLCGEYLSNPPDQRRRRADLRFAADLPKDELHLLCLTCDRIAKGEPEPKVDWFKASLNRMMEVPPI